MIELKICAASYVIWLTNERKTGTGTLLKRTLPKT
jgi:hypothetical protein